MESDLWGDERYTHNDGLLPKIHTWINSSGEVVSWLAGRVGSSNHPGRSGADTH